MPKAIWTPEFHKIFVDLCLEQTLQGNKPETHFNRDGWKNILESFNERTGSSYDRMQLKNHWDLMSKNWKVWRKLTECSCMKWDPDKNTFGASDEDWARYLEANADAAQYRLNPPAHIKKLDIIFGRNNVDACNIDLEDDEHPAAPNGTKSDQIADNSHAGRYCDKYYTGGEDEQSMSSSLGSKPKGYWTPRSHNLFIDLCLQETLDGNKPGTHFTREGWKNIMTSFNERIGMGYDRLQLKNHWDTTKKQWKIWCKLIGTDSMKWDPDTRTFGATADEWTNYIQANPAAAQFRCKQIPLADKLEIIFDGKAHIGETDPPAPFKGLRGHCTPASPLYMIEPAPASADRQAIHRARRRKLNGHSTSLDLLVDGQIPVSPLHKNEPATASPGREVAHHYDAVESRSNITIQRSPANVPSAPEKRSYSIGECIECLDGMEEVEQGSDLYLFALDIFLKKEYREIFLQLKKPTLRIAWLQRLQSFGPPLA